MDSENQVRKEEYLRPKDVQALLKIGHNKFYQLVADQAFPVSRPHGHLLYVKLSDLERFIETGYNRPSN